VGNFLKRADAVIDFACAIAVAANVGMFAFFAFEGNKEMQLLSVVNLFLLSFRLLKPTHET
jgi:hypothetical protein